ncbi:MAG: sulfatase, partial [Sorangium cellulosum]
MEQDETRLSQARKEQGVTKGIGAWPARFVRSLMGATIASAVVCALDAMWTHSALAQDSGGPGFGGLFLSGWGSAAPFLLGTAGLFALLALVFHPSHAPSLLRYIRWLRDGSEHARVERALLVPLGIVGAWIWVVLTAHTSRALLSTVSDAQEAGFAIATASVLGALLSISLVLGAFAGMERMVRPPSALRDRLGAWWTGALALVLCSAMGAWGVLSGSTGGEGGLFGFMGVLKRLELDLRAPTLLLAVGLAAFLSAGLLRRVWASIAVVVAFAPLGLTAWAAGALDQSPKVAAALERSSPLGKNSLRVLRRLTDRDRDGAAAYFGGGDCNDTNPDINPLGIDVPGNGIDEDCSGEDWVRVTPPTTKPVASAKSVKPNGVMLPKNLNVIFITVDTLRWDMGYTGYPRNITPALDALAERSTIYEQAYAMSAYTGKSIGPMISGKYPSETNMGWKHYNHYPKKDRMVQERLQAAGIYTMAIHCHWYF